MHVGFLAPTPQAVHDFYDAALSAGGKDNGAPGPRPLYGEPYYGCFVRDLDSHKIEAAYWDIELWCISSTSTNTPCAQQRTCHDGKQQA